MRVILIIAVALLLSMSAQAGENTGPNRNIVKELVGTLRLQTKSDQRYRGVEEWRIFVHPDGSRTMMLSKDFVAANALQIMTVHVDRGFRPIDVYAAYWSATGYRGSIRVALTGEQLHAVAEGPAGPKIQKMNVPDEISVVTHGESMNGWYLWQGTPDALGLHATTYFNLNPFNDDTPVIGRLQPANFQHLGQETITVPAGTFDTDIYLLDNIRMWISGDERILVKQIIIDEDKEYVLTQLAIRSAEATDQLVR